MKSRHILVVLGTIALFTGLTAGVQASNHAEREGKPMVQVTVPKLTMPEQTGKFLFDESCASCHGTNAAGQDGVAPPLVHIIYEPNHHADVSFQMAAQRGVRAHHWPFGDMPPVEGVTSAEVKRITQYVRAVQRANGIQ
ncbi:c-type cytochrome [Cohaesibacter celericrescens]|jgi:mono/diheme cytochrome c family protein|uniref:Cytochrome C n=1 Tax=Cohaesibacter celericrescens TaxID=2067669 RepID=A0A2N5XJY3_9HYPH|nr:cytochrome c [Cohaesibacter celericrescens]PLW74831.1 cytochrome C [Cohaesibacter celericrescens]